MGNDHEKERAYIAIDLKSFYASAECMDRGLDPLTTNLVVADSSRTQKTICLAVSPSLKAYGISGRARLFEVYDRIEQVNAARFSHKKRTEVPVKSFDASELARHPEYEVDFIVATPQMARYIEISTQIYQIYLKYIAPEDIHVYSIDEVFIDATSYLNIYQMSAHDLAMTMIRDVLGATGITATAGIGTNMYLAKVAMDIVAKHMAADADGVRIAALDEAGYRRRLWEHKPITDFWRVGPGYAAKLKKVGIYTMGDIAKCSVGRADEYYNEDLLYKLFGINAELLIDHAWGWEPCTIADVKAYRPSSNSVSSGQVLKKPYTHEEARVIVQEMADSLALDLARKRLETDQIVLTIGYDAENLSDPDRRSCYSGKVKRDHYGRAVPEHGHGTENLKGHTASSVIITEAALGLYERVCDPALSVRRVTITANNVVSEGQAQQKAANVQLSIFDDSEEQLKARQDLEREKRMQQALIDIKNRYGKNAVFRGTDLKEGATGLERNEQIGGHKA